MDGQSRRPSRVKRILLVVGGLVLLVVAVFAVAFAEMFLGNRPIEDGRIVNGIRVVADGFTTMGVVPVGPREVILIDAGMDAAAEALKAELSRRGIGIDAVKAVFLTHGHADHLGALPILPGAEVIALAAEAPIIEGRQRNTSPMGRLTPANPTGVTVTRLLRDGEMVTVGDTTVRVFAVPGHTAGSAAYLVNGVLFIGDSGQISREGRLKRAPWLVTDDRAQNVASLVRLQRTLAAEGVTVAAIVPAHSGVAEGMQPLAQFAQDSAD